MGQKSVLSQLRELSIGETLIFPIEKRSSVKSTVSTFAVQWSKKFITKSDTEHRTFKVVRIA